MKWLLGIVAVLIVLLCCPVRAEVQYHRELRLRVGYLCFRFQVLPQKPKPEQPARQKSARTKKQQPPQKERSGNRREVLDTVLLLLKALPAPLLRLLKRICIDCAALRMNLTGADAAEAAIRAGRANEQIYRLYAVLGHLFTVQPPRILILPDCVGEEDDIRATARIRVRPWALIAVAAGVGYGFLKGMLDRRGQAVAKASDSPASNCVK